MSRKRNLKTYLPKKQTKAVYKMKNLNEMTIAELQNEMATATGDYRAEVEEIMVQKELEALEGKKELEMPKIELKKNEKLLLDRKNGVWYIEARYTTAGKPHKNGKCRTERKVTA